MCNIDTTIFIGVMGIFTAVLVWIISRMDNDIRTLSSKIDANAKSLGEKIDADMKAQTARTDQLYQMFIDLLKNKNDPKTNP